MVNCVPVFLASDPEWAQKFRDAGLPIVGDDIKSQVGATIVHRSLARLFADRGVTLDRTYQLNTAGNTDFLNMLERKRLKSKKISKTESVQSQLDERLDDADIHIGPSDYIPWQHDNKIAFIRMEGRGFGDAPLEVELRLSVQDSSNSAGVVIDALRCAKLALERGVGGPLRGPSAYYMKTPPRQFRDSVARDACNAFIDGEPFEPPGKAPKSVKIAGRAARSGLSKDAGPRMAAATETLLFDFGGTLDADGVAWKERILRPLSRRRNRHDRRGVRARLSTPQTTRWSAACRLPPDCRRRFARWRANLEAELGRRGERTAARRVVARFLSDMSAVFARNRPVLEATRANATGWAWSRTSTVTSKRFAKARVSPPVRRHDG